MAISAETAVQVEIISSFFKYEKQNVLINLEI